MTKICDIAIVGAGPAGAFFAKEVARLCPNMRVILIDGQDTKNKKPCGGLLAPCAQKIFAEYNITLPKEVLTSPQIFKVDTFDLVTGKKRYYQRCYLNMDRYNFDKWLVSLIPEGVDIVEDRVKKIEKGKNSYTLTLSDGEIIAKTVVGADGSNSLVRRTLGIKNPKQYVSIQEWYKQESEKIPHYSCIFDAKTSDSCSWTIHKDGYIIYGGAFEKKGCREAFAEQKARLEEFVGEKFAEPLFREACLVSSPRSMSDFSSGKPGMYLIGEAAGFISASSFEGISNALISARELAASFKMGKTQGEVLKIYRKRTKGLCKTLKKRMIKRKILFSQPLRTIILSSGYQGLNIIE